MKRGNEAVKEEDDEGRVAHRKRSRDTRIWREGGVVGDEGKVGIE